MRLHTSIISAFIAAGLLTMTLGCEKETATTESAAANQDHDAVTTEQLEPYECGAIKRLHTYDGLFLASQPSAEDFEQVKKSGVVTVINQRHTSEIKDFDESEVVSSLGLKYENPAWSGSDELTDELIDHTRQLLDTVERPALLHCGSGNRVGAIWFAYRALDGGLDIDEALVEAKTVGLKSSKYEEIVRDYIARHREK